MLQWLLQLLLLLQLQLSPKRLPKKTFVVVVLVAADQHSVWLLQSSFLFYFYFLELLVTLNDRRQLGKRPRQEVG